MSRFVLLGLILVAACGSKASKVSVTGEPVKAATLATTANSPDDYSLEIVLAAEDFPLEVNCPIAVKRGVAFLIQTSSRATSLRVTFVTDKRITVETLGPMTVGDYIFAVDKTGRKHPKPYLRLVDVFPDQAVAIFAPIKGSEVICSNPLPQPHL